MYSNNWNQSFSQALSLPLHVDRFSAERVALDARILQLEATLRELKHLRNSLTPISGLHPEILSDIFVNLKHYLGTDANGLDVVDLGWIPAVTHVCSSWREIALHTPQLWTWIVPDGLGIYRETLKRAQINNTLPLTIYYHPDDFDDNSVKRTSFRHYNALPKTIKKEVLCRVKRLDVKQGTARDQISWLYFPGHLLDDSLAPLLKYVRIDMSNLTHEHPARLSFVHPNNWPAVEQLILVQCILPEWKLLGMFLDLVDLSITLGSDGRFSDYTTFQSTLNSLSQLKTLKLSNVLPPPMLTNPPVAPEMSSQDPTRRIHLPNIRYICIHDTPARMAQFFDALSDESISNNHLRAYIIINDGFDFFYVLIPFVRRLWLNHASITQNQYINHVAFRSASLGNGPGSHNFEVSMDLHRAPDSSPSKTTSPGLHVSIGFRYDENGSVFAGQFTQPELKFAVCASILMPMPDLSRVGKFTSNLLINDAQWSYLGTLLENLIEIEYIWPFNESLPLLRALSRRGAVEDRCTPLPLQLVDFSKNDGSAEDDDDAKPSLFSTVDVVTLGSPKTTSRNASFGSELGNEWVEFAAMRAEGGMPLKKLNINIGSVAAVKTAHDFEALLAQYVREVHVKYIVDPL